MLTAVIVGIKQEPSHEADILEGLDLDLESIMQAATKRPFEVEDQSNEDDPNKRVKTETEPVQQNTLELDQGAEESLEDGLAMLVQNALNNANDFMFDPATDQMDIDGITDHPLPPPPPPSSPSVTFFSDPQKYLRKVSRHALGNMVGGATVETLQRLHSWDRHFPFSCYSRNPSTTRLSQFKMPIRNTPNPSEIFSHLSRKLSRSTLRTPFYLQTSQTFKTTNPVPFSI
jgi:membrane-associated HD superfamily phosphohydrolase